MSSAVALTGSPTPRRSTVSKSLISQENALLEDEKVDGPQKMNPTLKKSAVPLSTNKFGNQAAPKKMKTGYDDPTTTSVSPVDELLLKFSQQSNALNFQHDSLKSDKDSSTNSALFTDNSRATTQFTIPLTHGDGGDVMASVYDQNDAHMDGILSVPSTAEHLRLKLELEQAEAKIARMNQELSQSRITKHSVEQVLGAAFDADFALSQSVAAAERRIGNFQQVNNASLRPSYGRSGSWAPDDSHSEASDAMSAGGFNRARALWNKNNNNGSHPSSRDTFGNFQQNGYQPGMQDFRLPPPVFNVNNSPYFNQSQNQASYGQNYGDSGFNGATGSYRNDRLLSGLALDSNKIGNTDRRGNGRMSRRNGGTPYLHEGSNSSYDGLAANSGYATATHGPLGQMSMSMGNQMGRGYQQHPIGTPLSPFAPEFTASGNNWKNDAIATEGSTFLPTTEPLNYRRLLDRTVNCNWKYIVDKIVCNNDQQASIFLQQKLKVGTADQKYEIVEAIVAQAYPLMINRFGNFLVQRCFEHGTPEQVIKIATAIRGNTLDLSMDAFGCHVVQKAFDSVPEDYKAIMVHELLCRIPETVIHRYACHVWQKLFELRWTESPPQIMKYVNDALRGMWHDVALGETGSLVVQNIFENCLEEDKRPCIEEVLAGIDVVSHGQFGNWCIQHICEHGAPADRSRAIDHVLRFATEYSMDQFASKVVEKCLKIGGVEFLARYLERVCEGRVDRPRIPLIDIASDQYGNYLIQYILTHSNPQHREIVAAHIRKHMVSLRGSKFGSRVGMLCTNPAIATRPGPGVERNIGGLVPGQRMLTNPRYGGAYR